LKTLRIITLALLPLLLFATVTPTLGVAKNHTVKIEGGITVKINRSATEALFFAPGTTYVRDGELITFTNTFCDPKATCAISSSAEPHTISVVSDAFLKTIDSNTTILFFCSFDPTGQSQCAQILTAHGLAPGAQNPPKILVTATSEPSIFQMNGVSGNSIAILPKGTILPTGPADVVQVTINAQPGSYHFFCAIHPWMQGKIVVQNGNTDNRA
jgi:plastocyanin